MDAVTITLIGIVIASSGFLLTCYVVVVWKEIRLDRMIKRLLEDER